MITLRAGKRETLKDFFSTCSQKLTQQMKVMMYFPFLGNDSEIAEYLKTNDLGLQSRLKIQSAFRIVKNVRQQKSDILSLIDELQIKDHLKTPEERQRFLGRIKSIRHSLFKNLFSLLIAVKANNQPWALQIKRELSKFSPYWNFSRGIFFSVEEELKIRDFILTTLNAYEESFEDEEGVKILAEKLTIMGHSQEFRTIRSRLGADWSLTELRERFKNPLLKSEFFDFWYMVMMNRTSDAEVRQKFRQAINKRSLLQAKPGQMWVFEYFFPGDEGLRKIIIDKLLVSWNSANLIDRHTVLRTLESPTIKNELSEKDALFKRANFQIKREFFTEVLNSGYSTDNALYELYLLGDKNEDNLWWIML